MFRLASLALMIESASAFAQGFHPDSVAARKLLDASTLIEGRGLANDNNNANYALNQVMGSLYLKYVGCHNVYSLSGGQGGQGGNNKNGNANGGVWNMGVVEFELHEEGCNGALVGKYATNMAQFVDSYTESTMDEQEWKCENYRETVCAYSCQNNNNNNNNGQGRDYCYYQCFMNSYTNSGTDLSACAKYYSGEEAQEFELQRYLNCGQLKNNNKNNNNNNNNNNGQYQVQHDWSYGYTQYSQWDGAYRSGVYCDPQDNKSIKLGVFYDQWCAVKAPDSVYSELNYGAALPYSTETMVPKDSCLSCVDAEAQYEQQQKQQNNNNNNNNNANGNNWYNVEPREFCIEAYQTASRCENPDSQYLMYGAVTTGCDFIEKYLPKVSQAEDQSFSNLNFHEHRAAVAFAWIFAATTIIFASYAFVLQRKTFKSDLSNHDGVLG